MLGHEGEILTPSEIAANYALRDEAPDVRRTHRGRVRLQAYFSFSWRESCTLFCPPFLVFADESGNGTVDYTLGLSTGP